MDFWEAVYIIILHTVVTDIIYSFLSEFKYPNTLTEFPKAPNSLIL